MDALTPKPKRDRVEAAVSFRFTKVAADALRIIASVTATSQARVLETLISRQLVELENSHLDAVNEARRELGLGLTAKRTSAKAKKK